MASSEDVTPAHVVTKTECSNDQDTAVSANIDVEVRADGHETTTCRMRPTTLFKKLMHAWCKHQKVGLEEVRFSVCTNGHVLSADDTPDACEWTPEHGTLAIRAELITVGAVSSSRKERGVGMAGAAKPGAEGTLAADPLMEKISVIVEDDSAEGKDDSVEILMRPTTQFGMMMTMFCKHRHIPETSVSFEHEGRQLAAQDTPATCGWTTPSKGPLPIKAHSTAAQSQPMTPLPLPPQTIRAPPLSPLRLSQPAANPDVADSGKVEEGSEKKVKITVYALCKRAPSTAASIGAPACDSGDKACWDYDMRLLTPFSKLMTLWCKAHQRSVNDVLFVYKDKEVDPAETPGTKGWSYARDGYEIWAKQRNPASLPSAPATSITSGQTSTASASSYHRLNHRLNKKQTSTASSARAPQSPKGATLAAPAAPPTDAGCPQAHGVCEGELTAQLVPIGGAAASSLSSSARKGSGAATSAQPGGKIVVLVQAAGKDNEERLRREYKMLPTSPFRRIMKTWARHLESVLGPVSFLYEGHQLQPKATPQSVGWSQAGNDPFLVHAVPRDTKADQAKLSSQSNSDSDSGSSSSSSSSSSSQSEAEPSETADVRGFPDEGCVSSLDEQCLSPLPQVAQETSRRDAAGQHEERAAAPADPDPPTEAAPAAQNGETSRRDAAVPDADGREESGRTAAGQHERAAAPADPATRQVDPSAEAAPGAQNGTQTSPGSPNGRGQGQACLDRGPVDGAGHHGGGGTMVKHDEWSCKHCKDHKGKPFVGDRSKAAASTGKKGSQNRSNDPDAGGNGDGGGGKSKNSTERSSDEGKLQQLKDTLQVLETVGEGAGSSADKLRQQISELEQQGKSTADLRAEQAELVKKLRGIEHRRRTMQDKKAKAERQLKEAKDTWDQLEKDLADLEVEDKALQESLRTAVKPEDTSPEALLQQLQDTVLQQPIPQGPGVDPEAAKKVHEVMVQSVQTAVSAMQQAVAQVQAMGAQSPAQAPQATANGAPLQQQPPGANAGQGREDMETDPDPVAPEDLSEEDIEQLRKMGLLTQSDWKAHLQQVQDKKEFGRTLRLLLPNAKRRCQATTG